MIVSYINIAIKLVLGLLSLVMVINFTGKGNSGEGNFPKAL